MDSNSELNPDLPQETRDAIRAGLLESEALELEARAAKKERVANAEWVLPTSGNLLRKDAAIFREEAASKRAKAEALRKAVTP